MSTCKRIWLTASLSLLGLLAQPPKAAMPKGLSEAPPMAGITFTHLYQTANNLLSKRAQDYLHYLKHQVGTE